MMKHDRTTQTTTAKLGSKQHDLTRCVDKGTGGVVIDLARALDGDVKNQMKVLIIAKCLKDLDMTAKAVAIAVSNEAERACQGQT